MRFILFSSLFLLSSCAYVIDNEATQEIDVKFASPQKAQASCYFENEQFKQHVIVPGKTRMQKSHLPLEIYCVTGNGPEYVTTVEASLAPETYLNVFNGVVPGGTYDYLSKTAYEYPDEIIIDFESTGSTTISRPPVKPYGQEGQAYFAKIEEPVIYEQDLQEPLDLMTPSGTYISRDLPRYK